MQIEREDTYLRFIRWSHHSQRRLAGKKIPDRLVQQSFKYEYQRQRRSKELVNRATVRRKHPVHSCRNRTHAIARKSKETKGGKAGEREDEGALARHDAHTRVYIYAYVRFLLAYTHARVRARNLNEGACDERARMHVKASVHADKHIAGCENRRAKIDQSGAEAGVGGAATWCRSGQ